MYPLKLSINPAGWRKFTARRTDPAFKSFREKILNRDGYTCQFCGFQAREFQEIINLDNNYNNNAMSNMVTSCVFCAQCFFVESAEFGETGGGLLVYLPELTQPEINSLCHVIFCAVTNNTGYKETAQSLYRNLRFRSQIVEEKFGEGTSHPAIFGQMIVDSSQDIKVVNQSLLEPLRLLPSRAKFRKQIEYWARKAMEEISAENNTQQEAS